MWTNDLNLDKTHTFKNTLREDYNCGGYALETYTWYRPVHSYTFDFGSCSLARKKNGIKKATQHCVDIMLQEFAGSLRVINDIKELQENEYAIAFRISGDSWNDFHYIKRAKNGCWYQKQGRCPKITRVPKEEVFANVWISGDFLTYKGQLVLFAKKEN